MSSDTYNRFKEEVISLQEKLEAAEEAIRERDRLIYQLKWENRMFQYEKFFENYNKNGNEKLQEHQDR